MNPTIGAALIFLVGVIITGTFTVWVAKINASSNREMRAEIAANKADIIERVDGRVDGLLETIRQEGIEAGKKEQSAIITEEQTRVAGVQIEAQKRSDRAQ
jgi:hypothetical protein